MPPLLMLLGSVGGGEDANSENSKNYSSLKITDSNRRGGIAFLNHIFKTFILFPVLPSIRSPSVSYLNFLTLIIEKCRYSLSSLNFRIWKTISSSENLQE